MSSPSYDISVVIPFGDDEEVIGRAVRRVAAHLGELGYRFEILCVDEDSGDNSHALLGLLRAEVPELVVTTSVTRGRGAAVGIRQARGVAVCLMGPQAALQTLAPLDRAVRRVLAGDLDVVVVDGRLSVCRRARILDLGPRLRGGSGVHERMAKRAVARGMSVERHRIGGGGPDTEAPGAERPWARLFGAGPLRAALTLFNGDA